MLFKVVDKVRWKTDEWDKIFNLVNDFKKEFEVKLKSINNFDGELYFNLDGWIICIEENNSGFWVTLESNTSKADFDEKYEFIFSRLSD